MSYNDVIADIAQLEPDAKHENGQVASMHGSAIRHPSSQGKPACR